MARNSRKRRGGASFSDPGNPTQRTRVVARRTPDFQSSRAGLEGLDQALSNFFGQTQNALDNVAQAEHAREVAEIEEKNQEQRYTGAFKAASGQDLSEEERKDRDFVDAHTEVLASEAGIDAAQSFKEFARERQSAAMEAGDPLPDIDTLENEFVQGHFANGDKIGTGDPLFDATSLDTFQQAIGPFRKQSQEAQVKQRLIRGQKSLRSSIIKTFESDADIEFGEVKRTFDRAKELHPLDPEAANSAAVDSLVAAARNSPARVPELIGQNGVLLSPASGDGTRSFAEMFPAFDELEAGLTSVWLQGNSVEGDKALSEVSQILDVAISKGDIGQIGEIISSGGAIDKLKERHGNSNGFERIRSAGIKGLMETVEDQVEYNQAWQMLSGSAPYDAKKARKFYDQFVADATDGGDFWTHPEDAADIAADLNFTLPNSRKDELTAALTDMTGTSAERFSSAMRFLTAIEARGEGAAIDVLGKKTAKEHYLIARRKFRLTRQPFEQIMEDLRSVRRESDSAPSWQGITGAGSESEAYEEVRGTITDALEEASGIDADDMHLSPDVFRQLSEYGRNVHAKRRGTSGDFDWEENLTDAFKVVSPNLQYVPGEEGMVNVEIPDIPAVLNVTDRQGNAILDGEGRPIARPTTKLAQAVRNPDTGQPENTLARAQRDLENVAGLLAGNKMGGIEIGDEDILALDPVSRFSSKGIYPITAKSNSIFLQIGEPVSIGGKEVALTGDPIADQNLLDEMGIKFEADEDEVGGRVPDENATQRIMLIPFPHDSPSSYVLGYRPGFALRNPSAEELKEQDVYRSQLKRATSPGPGPHAEKGALGVQKPGEKEAAEAAAKRLEEANVTPRNRDGTSQ